MHYRQFLQPKSGCASYILACERARAAVVVDPLGDAMEIHPAHFGRSPCGGRNLGCKPFSTIGFERRFNLALQLPTPDAFGRFVLSTLRPQPDDFRRIKREKLGWS